MAIELDEKSYILGMWFSSDPISLNNWLACIVRDPDNQNRYKGWSRFRYVKDSKIFDGEDEKSWTTFLSRENISEDSVIEMMDLAQKEIQDGYPEKDRVIVKGDLSLLMHLAKDKEWMHLKQVEA